MYGREIKSESLFLLLNIQVDRTATKVTVVPQKEKKDYSFQENILELVVDCLDKGVVPNPEVTILTFICILDCLLFQYPIDQALDRKRRHTFVKVKWLRIYSVF